MRTEKRESAKAQWVVACQFSVGGRRHALAAVRVFAFAWTRGLTHFQPIGLPTEAHHLAAVPDARPLTEDGWISAVAVFASCHGYFGRPHGGSAQ